MRHSLIAAVACSLAALSTSVEAQTFQFAVDQSNTNYTWSGTTSVGNLIGNPSNTFQLSGTVDLLLGTGGNPVGDGQWTGADMLVTPDLSGVIPNPIPGFPALATIDVAGMRFSITSDPFTVDNAGNFTTMTTLEVTAGTLTVTPLVGASTQTDLTGTFGPPAATSGTLIRSGSMITMVSPMVTAFDFTDPASKISATIDLVGTITAIYTCLPAANYCPLSPNSASPGSVISTTGSTFISDNAFGLSAAGAPGSKPGIFFVGPNQVSLPLGDGTRCVGGAIKRLGILISSPAGVFTQGLDMNNLPGGAAIDPGVSTNFQCWFRDTAAGGAGFNLSNATEVIFCP
ncbi:MAG: hypothetical protein ACI8X5_000696 [Planctomycetota bacterium]|jgi:hypothetical protein